MAAWNSAQNRLAELRQRWEANPASRLFLQLAEEYRRQGRANDALHVLRVGMEHNPTSLAGQVAMGRCLLDASDLAGAKLHLEQAVKRDPTQMVAYRHLIQAHLGLGDGPAALRCLEIYRQLNSQDPDLADLERAAHELEARSGAAPEPPEGPEPDASSEEDISLFSPSAIDTAKFPPLRRQVSVVPRGDGGDLIRPGEPAPPSDMAETTTATKSGGASDSAFDFGDSSNRGGSGEFDRRIESGANSQRGTEAEADQRPLSTPFGYAGGWETLDEEGEDDGGARPVFFEPSVASPFVAPQGGVGEATVVWSGQASALFALDPPREAAFDLFSLPSRPLRRPRPRLGRDGLTGATSGAVRAEIPEDVLAKETQPSSAEDGGAKGRQEPQAATETLGRLYQEQGHLEEADRIYRQVHGHSTTDDLAISARSSEADDRSLVATDRRDEAAVIESSEGVRSEGPTERELEAAAANTNVGGSREDFRGLLQTGPGAHPRPPRGFRSRSHLSLSTKSALRVVDFVPRRLLLSLPPGAARRRVVLGSYLDRLLQDHHVS